MFLTKTSCEILTSFLLIHKENLADIKFINIFTFIKLKFVTYCPESKLFLKKILFYLIRYEDWEKSSQYLPSTDSGEEDEQ